MAYIVDKVKLKKHLKEMLKREPKSDEIMNAQSDPVLVQKVVMEEMDVSPQLLLPRVAFLETEIVRLDSEIKKKKDK